MSISFSIKNKNGHARLGVISTAHGEIRFYGWRLFQPAKGGFRPSYYSLLVIDTPEGRTYRNWSFRNLSFDEIPPGHIKGMALATTPRCVPKSNFADSIK